jgi:DNA (cytosine-5)-methyltransferase 1
MENVRGHLTLGFGDVLADLASCGYSAEWQIIPASAVGAPHRRDRLFFVAYSEGGDERISESYGVEEVFGETAKSGERHSDCRTGEHRWESEPDVDRVAHGVPARVDRLRGLGNAVVPQVAEFVGRMIAEHADN